MKPPDHEHERDRVRRQFNPDGYDWGWFRADDLEDSMRSALLINIGFYLALYGGDAFPADSLRSWREFFQSVLERRPYVTADINIISTAASAAQTVSKSWETREKLIAKFVKSTRCDGEP